VNVVVRATTFTSSLAAWFAAVLVVAPAAAAEIAVTGHGAVPDGKTPATEAIQAAIDACQPGDTVVFPRGRFVSGSVRLRSGITLRLDEGAVWLASRDPADYPGQGVPALVRGDRVTGVTIEGQGSIDGQAEHEWREEGKQGDDFIRAETENARRSGVEMKRSHGLPPRPSMLVLRDSRDLRLKGIAVRRSPFWSVHFANCEDVVVEGVRIESSLEAGVNADGLDVDGCRRVRVRGCTIATGDDAVCLKSTRGEAGGAPCEDVTVEDCVLTSTSCALKIGTETYGDFRRIVFRDCEIRDSNRGLGIFVRDGATVSDVTFSRIRIECNRKHYQWWGDGDPLRFVVLKRKPDSKIGRIEKVRVEDVTARGQGTSLIAGLGPGTISGVSLVRTRLTMEAEGKPDKRASDGLIVRDAARVSLEDVDIRWDTARGTEPKWRSGLRVERADDLRLEQVRIDATPGSGAPAVTHAGGADRK
jgi:hypothetical protein